MPLSKDSPSPVASLVTVGMPVYNGERHLAAAIESVLGQSLETFELVIADNASTDATMDICTEYAKRDSRVRYLRHTSNIGAPRNYSHLVPLARGRYFKWASGNDICDPRLLARCIEILEADASVVLCYGATRLIDDDGTVIDDYSKDVALLETRGSQRYRALRRNVALNNAMNGVIRVEALRSTRLIRPYVGSDITMMAILALLGKFVLLPDVLFQRRIAEGTFSGRMSRRHLEAFIDPTTRAPLRRDKLHAHVDHLISIWRAPISWRERIPAFATACRHIAWDRHALARELFAVSFTPTQH